MTLFWLHLLVVIVSIAIGAKYGGVGLGAAGGLGMAVLVFVFGLRPASPPIDVLLIITAVITCVSILQAAGGLDYLVLLAERMLRHNPNNITFMGPLVCYLFTIFCGTAYVAFSVYPVIAEVAIEARVRPERSLTMSVVAAQAGITGSPMSAATAAMLGLLAVQGVTPLNLMLVCIPACFLAGLIGCLFMYRRGAELENDAEFQRRLASGEFQDTRVAGKGGTVSAEITPEARRSVVIFGLGLLCVVSLGSMTSLLPAWEVGGKLQRLSIPFMIQIIMLAFSCLIMVLCRIAPSKLASGSVFRSGMIGMAAVYGISWLTGTFFNHYKAFFINSFGETLASYPLLFAVALFILSAALFSQGATVTALMPLGLTLGLAPASLVAMFPAVNGYFIIPAGGAIVGCVAFDRTGTTRIGRYVLNHSYMLPGLVTTGSSLVLAYLFSLIIF